MEIFEKDIDTITEQDLLNLENLPNNFESHRIDYKVIYEMKPKHKNEFLRDIVSFANNFEDSLLIYGMNDNRRLVGMERNSSFNEDMLQNHFNNLLETTIEPKIKSHIKIQPVSLKNGKFAIVIKIFASDNIIYGIRQKLDKNIYGKEVNAYEFWYRASGNKKPMNLNEVLNQVLFKNKPNLKIFCHNSKDKYDLSKLIRTTETGYVKTNFRLKNVGEITANGIDIRLKCNAHSNIKFLNKWNYNKQILKVNTKETILKLLIPEQKKRLKKMKNPSVVPNNRENNIFWKFHYEIDKIGSKDSLLLPPIYILIPDNLSIREINFKAKIISKEPVNYEEKNLKFYW